MEETTVSTQIELEPKTTSDPENLLHLNLILHAGQGSSMQI